MINLFNYVRSFKLVYSLHRDIYIYILDDLALYKYLYHYHL